jgi:hypothetical protein
MWHHLWPMHRGYGYLQNYLDRANMNALDKDLTSIYQPVFQKQLTKLLVQCALSNQIEQFAAPPNRESFIEMLRYFGDASWI